MQNPVQKKIQDNVLEIALDLCRRTKGQRYIPITGHSMYPLIREGDQVLVLLGWTGIQRGDVIVFRREGVLIAHRVMSIDKTDAGHVLITKGDNVPYFDPPLNDNQIVGRVLAVKRGSRQAPLNTAVWRALGWLIVVGTLSFSQLLSYGMNLRQNILVCISAVQRLLSTGGYGLFPALYAKALRCFFCNHVDCYRSLLLFCPPYNPNFFRCDRSQKNDSGGYGKKCKGQVACSYSEGKFQYRRIGWCHSS